MRVSLAVIPTVAFAWLFMAHQALFSQARPGVNEEYQIYEAILAPKRPPSAQISATEPLVLRSQTVKNERGLGDNWRDTKRRLGGLTGEAIADYVAKNKSPEVLTHIFNTDIKYVLIPESEIVAIWANGREGWSGFYKKYSQFGGYTAFSRVGFDSKRKQALVYMEHWCGVLCGTGHYLLLSKKRGVWSVKSKIRLWIS